MRHANLARGNVGNIQLEPGIASVLKATATAIIGAFNHVPYRGTANITTYLRVAQVSMETRAPVTPGTTGGIEGALSLGMPRGLTPPAEAGGGDPRYYRRS